jgi:RNA polymerase sigma factor (sigma-70 family)
MSAITTFVEAERRVCGGGVGEHAQELDCVVSRYLPMFYKRALRFLGNTADAEDAVQDALLSAYRHLGQFRGEAQLSTWLMTIVTYAALMQLRRRHSGYFSLDQEQGGRGSHILGKVSRLEAKSGRSLLRYGSTKPAGRGCSAAFTKAS